MEAGNPAGTFWDQTPRTFAAIMEGCSRRERRAAQHAMAIGWHAANFGRAKHLKDLGHYLKQFGGDDINPADEAAAIFASFAEQGLVTIKVVPRKDD